MSEPTREQAHYLNERAMRLISKIMDKHTLPERLPIGQSCAFIQAGSPPLAGRAREQLATDQPTSFREAPPASVVWHTRRKPKHVGYVEIHPRVAAAMD